MLYLLDANAITDLIYKHPRFDSRLNGLGGSDAIITCATLRGEILYGLIRLPIGRKRSELESRVMPVFNLAPTQPIPPAADDHYATVKLACEKKGMSVSDNDLWIAATTLALGVTLVSRDTDFKHVDGLRVEDWTV